MAHSLLSARVQRGTVSLTGGREVTCVKGLQAPTLGLSLMHVARRWFQFLPGPCLLPERADTPSFLTQSLRKPFSKSKWPVDDLSQGCKGLV